MKSKFHFLKPKARRRLTDDEFNFIFRRVPALCLDFVVVSRGRILLTKRSIPPRKGLWHLPGGIVRYKESLLQAAFRILKKEIHCRPASLKAVGCIECINDGPWRHSVSIVLETTLETSEVRRSHEDEGMCFFKKLPQEGIHPEHRKFLCKMWGTLAGSK